MSMLIRFIAAVVLCVAAVGSATTDAHAVGHSKPCVTKTEARAVTPEMPRWRARQILDGMGEYSDKKVDVYRVCGYSKAERNIIFQYNGQKLLVEKRLYKWGGFNAHFR